MIRYATYDLTALLNLRRASIPARDGVVQWPLGNSGDRAYHTPAELRQIADHLYNLANAEDGAD